MIAVSAQTELPGSPKGPRQRSASTDLAAYPNGAYRNDAYRNDVRYQAFGVPTPVALS